jgi:hypothetical protein
VTTKYVCLFSKKERSNSKADKADRAKHTDEIARSTNEVKSRHPVSECAMARVVKLISKSFGCASLFSHALGMLSIFEVTNHCRVVHIEGDQVKNLAAQAENND